MNLTIAYYRCTNSACDSWHVVRELYVVTEPDTGAKYLRYEDELYCQDCKHEMKEC
jgi:hypothetical protein